MSHITGLGTRLTEGPGREQSQRGGGELRGELGTQGETGKSKWQILPINERMQRWVRQVSATRARERGDHVVLMELNCRWSGGREGGGRGCTDGWRERRCNVVVLTHAHATPSSLSLAVLERGVPARVRGLSDPT